MSEHGTDKDAGVHCVIPQNTGTVVSIPEFQAAFLAAKNKGQKLRVALRTLSSHGYLSEGMIEKAGVKEFVEDYKPKV